MTVGDLMPKLSGRAGGGDPGPRVDAAVLTRDATAIAFDSRRVQPGSVFVAIRGQHADGADFAVEAMRQGAVLVVSESRARPGTEGRWVQVTDARLALAELAAAFHGDPSRDLTVVGVTGTNGKTTTTYLLAAIFEAAGRPCGRIGTVTYRIGAAEAEAARTTPEAPELQALLREMVEQRVAACVMEVSSHALSMRRVDRTRFGAAVFTNLTREHLDFHADMAEYFEAKRCLFDMLPAGAPSVVNVDDPAGRRLAGLVGHAVTYAVEREAEVRPERVESTRAGIRLDVRTPRGRLDLRSPLPGRVNACNVLGAAAAALALDVPLPAIEQGVAALDGVPGRFEVVSSTDDDVWVLLDFAHTDDALRAVLGAVRELGAGRLISVFGCGGDRDRAKRPLMGAVAARLSDLVVLTSDNPRSEDPDLIIDQIRRGVLSAAGEGGCRHLAIADRRAAIERAIAEAEPGDTVVIAGKGHEREQVVGNVRLPFEDRAAARDALATRRARAAGRGRRERRAAGVNRGGGDEAARGGSREMDESWSMTLNELAGVVGSGRVAGAGETRAAGVSIDSRSIRPGDLFVAIRGARFDGHRFVSDALARGAAGALVSDGSALGTPPAPGIVVDDPVRALQALARRVRRDSGARVVAVTGSVGKTTTKELSAALLETRYRVFRNRGNLNNHIGLPLSLLELRAGPEVAVVELGMSRPGEIRRLVEIAEPDVRVWTNVAEAHAEFFPSIEAIADAKAEILTGASHDAVVVANAADCLVMRRVAGFPGRVVTFGVDVEADVSAEGVEDLGLGGVRARLRTPVGAAAVRTRLLGRGNLANVLAAVGVALHFDVPLAVAVERAAAVEAPPRRGRIHRLAGGVVVIDDSYNSSPLAVETALATLSRGAGGGRRVAVLGEMLELGGRSADLHRAAGRAAAAAGVGLLLTVGGDPARALGLAAVEAGAAPAGVLHCETSEEAAVRAAALVRDDDLVLVKGSRGVRTDLVVTRLCADRPAGSERG